MRKYRGMPPGLWELYHGEREMGITVQKLAAGLDCGVPIEEKHIPIYPNDTLDDVAGEVADRGAGHVVRRPEESERPGLHAGPHLRVGQGVHDAQFSTMGHSERTDRVPPVALPLVRSVPRGPLAFAGAVESPFSKPSVGVDR